MTRAAVLLESDGAHPSRAAECPKRMVYGPCGGVHADGRCEVDSRLCPFITSAAPRWPHDGGTTDRSPALGDAAAVQAWMADAPLIVCDFRPDEPTIASARHLAGAYAGWCDAILLGDHHDRVDLPNVVLADVVQQQDCRPWVTYSCRDRNRAVLEGDLAACAELEVPVVHCVTGDARAPHVRPDTTPVFDLDSLRLTALAHAFGLSASVAANPTVAPVDQRPARIADKYRAGASWCFVNVGADPEQLRVFIHAAGNAGARLQYVACVPVFTDAEGAARLQTLPGVSINQLDVQDILESSDPVEHGIAHAAARAAALLDIAGVIGVNLSGRASNASTAERVAVVREVARRVKPHKLPAGGSTVVSTSVPSHHTIPELERDTGRRVHGGSQ